MKLLHFVRFDQDEREVIREAFQHIELSYPAGFNIVSKGQVELSCIQAGIKCYEDALTELRNPKGEVTRPGPTAAAKAPPEKKAENIKQALDLLRRAEGMIFYVRMS